MKAPGTIVVVLLLVAAIGCGGGSTSSAIVTPPPATGFTAANLSGDYVATFAGSEGSGETYFVLRYTADGAGRITEGRLDYNYEEINQGMQSVALSGTYTVAKDGRTTLTITTAAPSLTGTSGPFLFATTLRTSGEMVLMPFEFPLKGSGSMWKVEGTSGSLSGTYSFSISGVSGLGFLDGAGQMNFDGAGNVSGTWDLNLSGYGPASEPFSGTYTLGADGRGTALLASTGPYPWYPAPATLSFQVVSPNKMVLLSADRGLSVVGTAEKKTGSISASMFSGAYVLSSTGTTYAVGHYGGGTAAAGRVVTDGKGAVTGGTLDQNVAYSVKSDATLSGTYGIDATGRGTATLNTMNGPVNVAFYPVSAQRAFFVTLDSGSIAHGTLDLQTGSNYSAATLKGGYSMVVAAPNFLDDDTCASGALTADGTGGLKGTLDVMTAGGLTVPGLPVSGTYVVDGNGRGTAKITNTSNGGSMNIVFYLLSTKEAVVLGADRTTILSGRVGQQ